MASTTNGASLFAKRMRSLCSTKMPPDFGEINNLLQSMTMESIGQTLSHRAYPKHRFPWNNKLLANLKHITCISLVETQYASCTLFILPPGQRLELHDHPNQTVFCKVLHGSLGHYSFDWDTRKEVNLERAEQAVKRSREYFDPAEAVLVGNTPLQAGEVHQFSPAGGGVLHQFFPSSPSSARTNNTAAGKHHHHSDEDDGEPSGGEPVVFCDVITPPYCVAPDYVDCTYWEPCGEGAAAPSASRYGEMKVGERVSLQPMGEDFLRSLAMDTGFSADEWK